MQIVFLFYEGMTALDAIGPHEILCRLPDSNTKRVAKQAGIQFAQAIQLSIEYDPAPLFDVGSSKKADPTIREALRTRMVAEFESPT